MLHRVATGPSLWRQPWRLTVGAALAGVALTVAALGATSALGLFTSTASIGSNGFTTGTLSLGATPATALLSASAMAPGDAVTAPLTLSNTGTMELRYAMTTSADNPDGKGLRDQLQLTVKTQGTGCAAFDGTTLYGPAALAAGAIGSPAQGAQAGDRTLAPSASEVLCFRVELPLSTGNAFQGATTTATFTFQAEQTANNP